ncbi:PfkB family carbohydrate kinase [Phenylobacterium sp.]|jgi:pyridoxine kinase|uniref:PfkB family carbohydrate kinase n=1 Tax=Phenylobacterium sp. TaxID=1871053 RepID=UPI002F40D059
MPLALIFSSFVAANRIGGGAQQVALAALGVEAVLAPTILLSRNPAKGAVGRATEPELFQGLLDGIEAEGLFARADLVITGYFTSAAQVEAAAAAIGKVRATSPGVRVVTDPILGDEPKGLYVRPEVAEAVAAALVPRADALTPNAWELAYLTGCPVGGPAQAAAAARTLGRPVLATSVPAGAGEIGVVAADGAGAKLYAHPRQAQAPNGTGDLVTAVFAAGLVQGLGFQAAARRATGAAVQAVQAGGDDLPLVDLAERLLQPKHGLRIEIID